MYDVQTILSWKGATVHTVKSTASVASAAKGLADHDIGALVVTGAEGGAVGIVSERDILRALSAEGTAVLTRPVAEIMSRQVMTCAPKDKLADDGEDDRRQATAPSCDRRRATCWHRVDPRLGQVAPRERREK